MFKTEAYLRYSLKEKYQNQSVFCTPYISTEKCPDGLSIMSLLKAKNLLMNNGRYIPRKECEYANLFTQIVTLVIILNQNNKILVPSVNINDHRDLVTHNLFISSHLKPEYFKKDLVLDSISSKLNMNLNKLKFLGTIRDMNSLFSDHLAMVFLFKVNSLEIEYPGDWLDYDSLENKYFEFKSWSKILMDYISNNKSLFF